MSKFKPGDIVKLIDVSRYGYTEKMKQLSGQLLTVRSTLDDEFYPTVFAGIPGSIDYYPWHANDLELVVEAQLEQKTDNSLNQQNEVWGAVAKTLDEVAPGWLLNYETKEEATAEEIEAATKPKPLASKRRVEMPNSFTPGPWAIYFNSQDDFVIRKMFADGQESHVVARCHSGAANASLIASAPDLLRQRDELLEALIGLLGEAEAIAQVLPAYGESTNLKNARAVINKIGGDA